MDPITIAIWIMVTLFGVAVVDALLDKLAELRNDNNAKETSFISKETLESLTLKESIQNKLNWSLPADYTAIYVVWDYNDNVQKISYTTKDWGADVDPDYVYFANANGKGKMEAHKYYV